MEVVSSRMKLTRNCCEKFVFIYVGSESEGSQSRSPSPQIAQTPGYSLEHHDPEPR